MSVTPSPPGREAPIVLIVAKAPVAGRVKTRLAATLGSERATEVAVAMLLDTLEGCRSVFADVGFLCGADADVQLLPRARGIDGADCRPGGRRSRLRTLRRERASRSAAAERRSWCRPTFRACHPARSRRPLLTWQAARTLCSGRDMMAATG